MIIELFGLPGSGKTTCCSLISEKRFFDNPMYFFKEKLIGKIIFHIFILFCPFNFDLLKKYSDLKKCFYDLKKRNRLDCSVRLSKYVKYALFIYFLEKKNNRRNIIIDEGVIHYSMAIYAEFDVTFESCFEMIKILNLDINNVQLVLLNLDIETCISNIKKRNRHQTAIDDLNYFELVDILEKYREYIDMILKRMNVVVIDKVDDLIREELN